MMECVALAPESSHFIRDGLYTRFADWRFVHKARLSLTELNGTRSWASADQKKCGKWDETLPHVLLGCLADEAQRQGAPNQKSGGTLLSENQVGLRPDLVGNTLYIIDISIPFERGASTGEREEKYSTLILFFNSIGYGAVEIVPILVGARYPSNDKLLKLVATKKYLKTLKKLCVSDAIKWSRDICIQHLTGKRQYGNNEDTLPDTSVSTASPAHGDNM
ncbi:uncharacterized protein TNIN_216921 [Trichonephila inaurata madagascariensis]|uniref:Uncharacterized protein n=1 Tax=Trichonephila inaurata madagascariensis TaxID=2747483 RepID=A0A8X6X568_9ARAC|nr:uncharacterized protein TNIN_216921 [Trichonephila inaurata madagascariensis]